MQKSILSISPRSYRSVVSHWNNLDITIHDLINGDIITQRQPFTQPSHTKWTFQLHYKNTVWLYAGVVWILQIPLPCLSSQARRPDNSRGSRCLVATARARGLSAPRIGDDWEWGVEAMRLGVVGVVHAATAPLVVNLRQYIGWAIDQSINQSIILFISQHNSGTCENTAAE